MKTRVKNNIPIWKFGAKTIFKYGNVRKSLLLQGKTMVIASTKTQNYQGVYEKFLSLHRNLIICNLQICKE